MKKIILDTDIGSDIDDALALSYLLREPACELLGITTVSGEPVLRAELASAICCAEGRSEIPIYPGIARPILGRQYQPYAPQAEKLTKWKHRDRFPDGEAIDFMRRTVRSNPGEVTLLAIGPMTNVAALFCMDREIPELLGGLVLMCGNFDPAAPRAEWNAKCDAVATEVVYSTAMRTHRSYGLDVTRRGGMPAGEVIRHLRETNLGPTADFAATWAKDPEQTMLFHDPLAAVCLFEQNVCDYETGTVEIGIAPDGMRGMTRFCAGAGSCEVATDVRGEAFFDRFFGTIDRNRKAGETA